MCDKLSDGNVGAPDVLVFKDAMRWLLDIGERNVLEGGLDVLLCMEVTQFFIVDVLAIIALTNRSFIRKTGDACVMKPLDPGRRR